MKSLKVAIWVIAALAGTGWAQSAGQAASIGKFQVREISVTEIDTSHIKVAVDLAVVPAQTAKLKNIRLCSLHLNGQAAFAAPLAEEIALKKGEPTALPPLYVTLLFRDLETLEPFSRMIEKQSVRVEGELVADLQLNFLERLALATQHPKVAIDVDQEVPAITGGTPFARSAARSLIAVVDAGLKTKPATYIPGMRSSWIQGIETRSLPSLLMVESTYTLKKGNKGYPVRLTQLAFRIASGEALTTAEAEAPWKFDAECMGTMNSGISRLEKKSQEIRLVPIGPDAPVLSLTVKDFSIKVHGKSEQDTIAFKGEDFSEAKVLRRNTPGLVAVLTPRVQAALPGLALAPASMLAQDRWEQAVVFRLRINAANGKPSVEALKVSAYREGKSIHLAEPVDSAVFGSPIVTPEGVIGMVQDEQTGTFLSANISAPAR